MSTREAYFKTLFTAVSAPGVNQDIQKLSDSLLSYMITQTHAGLAAVDLLAATPGIYCYRYYYYYYY